MISIQALQKLLQPQPEPLQADEDSNMQLIGLRERAGFARDARNAQSDADLGPMAFLSHEKEDPNMGTMSILSQALDETGGRLGNRRALMRNRVFEKDALFGGR